MEVYGDPGMKFALKNALGDATPDAIYVDVDMDASKKFVVGGGLDVAGKLAKENQDKKIIIYGAKPIQELWLEPKFRKVMTHTNAKYVKLPLSLIEVAEKYSEKKFENPALAAIADIDYEKSLIGTFKHDYYYLEKREEVIERARKELSLKGSNEKIKKMIFEYDSR